MAIWVKNITISPEINIHVIGSRQASELRNQVRIEAGDHIVRPISTAKLLGATISQDAKWKNHILGTEQSLVSQLTSRTNGLSLVSPRASFSTRLMVANDIVISKLCYLIQMWGGCEDYLIMSLQVLQTRAALIVTQQNWFTPTNAKLSRCNWLCEIACILQDCPDDPQNPKDLFTPLLER